MLRCCVPLAVMAVTLTLSGCLHSRPSLPADGADATPFPILLRPDGQSGIGPPNSARWSPPTTIFWPPRNTPTAAIIRPRPPCWPRPRRLARRRARGGPRRSVRGRPRPGPGNAARRGKRRAGRTGRRSPFTRGPGAQRAVEFSVDRVLGLSLRPVSVCVLAARRRSDGRRPAVRGLNLPRRVVQTVMRGGLEAVAQEDRHLLPTDMPPMPPEQIEALAPYKAVHAEFQTTKPDAFTPDAAFDRGNHF